jgi:hypothetical protein
MPLDSENKKELESLTKLLEDAEAKRLSLLKKKLEPLTSREAYALLGYITRLEKIKDRYSSHEKSIPKEWISDEVGYDQHELQHGLAKLIGIAAAPSSNEKEDHPKSSDT